MRKTITLSVIGRDHENWYVCMYVGKHKLELCNKVSFLVSLVDWHIHYYLVCNCVLFYKEVRIVLS
jgi:hypothetical protein